MARKRTLTRSGLPQFLSSTLRTVKLKELATKRSKRLNILRKYIENVVLTDNGKSKIGSKKLSIESFAQMIGLKSGTWSRLERADSCLSIEAARWISLKVLEKFNVFVTHEWLIGEQDNDDFPRTVNKDTFNIYNYLKDVYKAEEIGYQLNDEDKDELKTCIAEITNEHSVSRKAEVIKIIKKYEANIMNKEEQDFFTKMFKGNKSKYSEEESVFLQSVVRRLIVSSDLSEEEHSKRLLLSGYFISDLFKKIQPNSIIAYVRDKKMSPIFNKGDVVGGAKISLGDLNVFDKRECIIELKSLVKVIRTVHIIENETIILSPSSNFESPEIVQIEDIKCIAIILFRYKNFEKENFNNEDFEDREMNFLSFDDLK